MKIFIFFFHFAERTIGIKAKRRAPAPEETFILPKEQLESRQSAESFEQEFE